LPEFSLPTFPLRPPLLVAVLIWLGTVWPVAGSQDNAPAAALLAELDALSARQGLNTQARATAFLTLVEPGFDLDHMASAALPPELRPEGALLRDYRAAYRSHMIHAHLRAQRFGATRSQLLAVRPLAGGGEALQIRVRADRGTQLVVWFTCPGAGFRVCDVETDGARMLARQRSSFGPALERLGWERFLDALRRGRLVEF